MSFSVDLNVVGLVAISVAAYFFSKRRNHLPLPPGPKKLPLLGNILDMPKEFDWETYHSWSKEYGMLRFEPFFYASQRYSTF